MNHVKLWALLDTGGELSLIPSYLVTPDQLRPSNQRIIAANGSNIQIKGEAIVDAVIAGIPSSISGLVADNVSLILGMDWMERNITDMNYANQTINFNGKIIKYQRPRNPAALCWKWEDLETPAPCEVPVPVDTDVIYHEFGTTRDSWSTEDKPGCHSGLVARMVIHATQVGEFRWN